MENHDEAYHVWRRAGVKQRILVHIDAHHDMWWIKDNASLTIANFICPALKEGHIRELFWVVPDQTWETPGGRKAVLRHLRRITKKYPGGPHPLGAGKNQVSTTLLGKPLTVCSLGSLPQIDEGVLLDIDVDFLVIREVSYGEGSERYGVLPWCWPDELLARLRALNIRADLITIAYSVEGGYTPLKWKYLGDELALRLKQPGDCDPMIRGMELLREAATAAHRGDPTTAEEKYQEAANLLPDSAAPHYHLAHLYLELGRTREGQEVYRRAMALDPSYRTPYNSAGFRYYWDRRFREAEQEHRRVLSLDPQDVHAHLGLGWLAARRKRWKEAELCFQRALALDGHSTDAYRSLGEVLKKQGRREEAIEAYERSLKLALAGHKPLEAPILTSAEDDHPRDPRHWLIHACLARLYERKGATTEAINGYRMSIAGGYDGVLIRSRLARLYVKQRQWKRSAQQAWQAVQRIPAGLRRTGRRLRWRLRAAILDARRALLAR